MPYTAELLKRTIEKNLPGSVAEVHDLKGTGDHFDAVIVCPEFEGKSRIEQHRMVHKATNELLEGDIHAFHFTTLTPDAAREGQPSR